MDKSSSSFINGKFLYYAFIAGGNKIIEHYIEINNINVFPVNDKDTGSNLASTVRSVIDNTKPHKCYKTTVNNIANAALIGARGNSGVIFAQFLHGLNQETKDKPTITLSEFAESVKRAIPYIYKAIANPVEGTMLTVIKEWSSYLSHPKNALRDFQKVIIESMNTLKISLDRTTTTLKALKKTGYVDAGAKGFVLFIEGIINFITTKDIRSLEAEIIEQIPHTHRQKKTYSKIKFRYCCEAIVSNSKLGLEELQETLTEFGDSIVIAGSEKKCRIHVHTNQPSHLINLLHQVGRVSSQKVDDMVLQQNIVHKKIGNIALVTDSSCDLPQEVIDYYQIQVIPLHLNFGNKAYLDKVTLNSSQFYHELENNEYTPVTSQVNTQTFVKKYTELAQNYDNIIAIHLSNSFSGTYENSKRAAIEVLRDKNINIHVINSKTLSGGLGLLVLKAAQLIERKKNVNLVLKNINNNINNSKVLVAVNQITPMIKSGRVKGIKGQVAQIMGLKPIISMNPDGESSLFSFSLSQDKSIAKILKHIKVLTKEKRVVDYMIMHAEHSIGAYDLRNEMIKILSKSPVCIINISSVIAIHAGKGCLSVALILTNKK